MLKHTPNALITDISHEVTPYCIDQAAYFIKKSYPAFPEKTFHVILFDCFSKKDAQITLTIYKGQYFFIGNDGLLPLLFEDNKSDTYIISSAVYAIAEWMECVAKTIIDLKSTLPDTLPYPKIKEDRLTNSSHAKDATLKSINCNIIHIDHYENIVVDMTRQQLNNLSHFGNISINIINTEQIQSVIDNYSEVKDGYKFARFNSAGYLEIGIKKGKGSSLFGVKLNNDNNQINIAIDDNKNSENEIFG